MHKWESWKAGKAFFAHLQTRDMASISLYCKDEATTEAVCEFLNRHITGWEVGLCTDNAQAAKAEA